VPAGRIDAKRVLTIGLLFSVAGIVFAAFFLNLLTAFFIAMGVFWYVFVYTLWLKPRTKWNIVIGGATGCFSALAGWSAVTGVVSLVGIMVAVLIFLWTPGHFWGLAIAKSRDYEDVEVPMLPVVEGVNRASLHTSISNLLLFPFTLALYLLTVNWTNIAAVTIIGVLLVVLNMSFVAANLKLMRSPSPMSAWRVFKFSAIYLFIALVLIVIGHLL
jgi:protoheme IX farnesyltransferase